MILNHSKCSLVDGCTEKFDLVISALGFETRCTAMVRNDRFDSIKYLFLKFKESDLFSYSHNKIIAENLPNVDFLDYEDRLFIAKLKAYVHENALGRIAVDISSMNRTMIAATLSSLMNADKSFDLHVYYVPAQFSAPKMHWSEIQAAGPVLPEFSAFDDASDLPTSIIVGLGYEYGIAVGLINRIEPRSTICLYATGHDDRFEDSVRQANLDFKFPGISATTLSYNLFEPSNTYNYISNTIRNTKSRYRISLIPLGPKILSSIFALISIEFLGNVTLWRVIKNHPSSNSIEEDFFVKYQVNTNKLSEGKRKFQEMISVY